jgi:hypothetical protein
MAGTMTWVGLDVHARSTHAAAIDSMTGSDVRFLGRERQAHVLCHELGRLLFDRVGLGLGAADQDHEVSRRGESHPPGARGTRRERLRSPGSHRPAVGAHAKAPVREQAGLAPGDVSDEPARPGLVAAQAFVFPHGPPHEELVEVAEDRIQHGLVEAPVVVDAALQHDVEHAHQVREGLVRGKVQPPAARRAPHRGRPDRERSRKTCALIGWR